MNAATNKVAPIKEQHYTLYSRFIIEQSSTFKVSDSALKAFYDEINETPEITWEMLIHDDKQDIATEYCRRESLDRFLGENWELEDDSFYVTSLEA